MPKDHTSLSSVQSDAEVEIRKMIANSSNGDLSAKKIRVSKRGFVRVDAASSDESYIAEIYARQGGLLDGQRKKIARDILKLAMLKKNNPECRVVFCYANKAIHRYLEGSAWISNALEVFGVEHQDYSGNLSGELRERIMIAQGIQATNKK